MERSDKERLTARQTLFLVMAFVNGSVLLLSFEDNALKQDSWMAIIAAFFAVTPFLLAIAMLAKRFPGKSFDTILCDIYGTFLGRVILLLYVFMFFVLLAFNMRDLADFYIGFISQEMPMAAVLIPTMLVAAYAVRKGITPIARVGFISVFYSSLVVVATFLLLIKDIDFTNFLPMFEVPLPKFLQGVHILAAIPYGEAYVFLMVLPQMRNGKKTVKVVYSGVALSVLFLLTTTIRNTAVLGPSSAIYAGNAYEAARMINIGEFLTRVELLTAIGIIVALFTKISVLFYVTADGAARLFGLKSSHALILPIGALAVLLAMIAFGSTVEHNYEASRYHMFFSLLFSFILPPLSLLIAAIRGLPRKAGDGDG